MWANGGSLPWATLAQHRVSEECCSRSCQQGLLASRCQEGTSAGVFLARHGLHTSYMNSELLNSASDRRCNDWLHVHACLLRLHYFLAHGSNMGHMQNLDMQLDGGSMTKFEQALYIFRLSGRESPCQKGDNKRLT